MQLHNCIHSLGVVVCVAIEYVCQCVCALNVCNVDVDVKSLTGCPLTSKSEKEKQKDQMSAFYLPQSTKTWQVMLSGLCSAYVNDCEYVFVCECCCLNLLD